MTAPNLGRLTTVPPRKVWTHEAQDFTPWLLQNVDVLSDLLGMNLVRRLLRELDAELALALALACERAGESLEWSAQDKKVLELIANQVDRMSDIAADYRSG